MAVPKIFDRWLGRLSGLYSFWPLASSSAVAFVMAYFSTTVDAINQYGAFGWGCVAIVSFIAASIGALILALAKEHMARAQAMRDWNVKVDRVNPIKEIFDQERIAIADLAHPVTRDVTGKVFKNCELFGPLVINLDGCNLRDVVFSQCDYAVAKPKSDVANVTVFRNCDFRGCKIWNCIVISGPAHFAAMRAAIPGIEPFTFEETCVDDKTTN